MVAFTNWFVKITGWPAYLLLMNTKYVYEDKKAQSRKIKGKAIIVSNHTTVFDYALMLFVFFGRTLRYQMAEVLFEKKGLGVFLKAMGGIFVNRNSNNYSFMTKSEEILKKGGVVGIFPESRIPLPDEEKPLPFKPGAAYLSLLSETPVIPVYTNGSYFHPFKKSKRTVCVIGTPVYPADLYDEKLSEKENLSAISEMLRQKIIDLGKMINGKE